MYRKIRPGDVLYWLDQGPVVLLKEAQIQDPISEEEAEEFFEDPEAWPVESGWTVALLDTGEILDVHEETLHVGISSPHMRAISKTMMYN